MKISALNSLEIAWYQQDHSASFCRIRVLPVFLLSLAWILTPAMIFRATAQTPPPRFRLSHFSADVTIPLGHRCMGVLPTKSKKIVDPLYARGFVLQIDGQKPIVFCAIDWCEIRNGSYDKFRQALATAAGTTRPRVLLAALHQHDAPVVDDDAARLLAAQGLRNELFDQAFQDNAIQRIAKLLRLSLDDAVPITHYGIGKAKVERIASNRRVVTRKDAKVSFARGSSSGRHREYAQAPEGSIDPFLKTLSFWNGDQPILAMSVYATHPMSYYGRGEVTSDFVGLAREKRQRDDKRIFQVHFSGCSGDVTAGKYNDGSPARRIELTERLYRGMVDAWNTNRKYPLDKVSFRNTSLQLPFHPKKSLQRKQLQTVLGDHSAPTRQRILAAMGLASLNRVRKKIPIDFPCVDLGKAKIILFPAEAFVGFQLMAQEMAPDSTVFSIGYGECWPGYIPTESALKDNFEDVWHWAGPGSEKLLKTAIEKVIR